MSLKKYESGSVFSIEGQVIGLGALAAIENDAKAISKDGTEPDKDASIDPRMLQRQQAARRDGAIIETIGDATTSDQALGPGKDVRFTERQVAAGALGRRKVT